MSLALSVSAITAISAQLNYASIAGGPSTIEAQVSPRPDFAFCVCPIFTTTTSTPQTIEGLNQRQTYFVRARGVTAAGVRLAWSNTESFRTLDATAQDLTPPAVFLDPALICLPETVFDLTTFIAGVPGYPVANIFDDGPSYFLSNGTDTGSQYHYIIFRSGLQPIDTISLLQTNMSEASQVMIATADSLADINGGTGTYAVVHTAAGRASANMPGRMGYHGLYRFAEQKKRWWSVQILTKTPGSRLQVGHMIVGKSIVSKRIGRDMGIALEDLGVIERNSFGIPDRQSGQRVRVVDFDIAMMDEAVYEALYAPIHQRVGNTDPVLVVPNPKAGALLHDRILYGQLSGGRVTNPVSKFYTRRFQVNSII